MLLDKEAGLNRLLPNKPVIPKSPVSGMNTKTLGRVAPVESVKQPVTKTAADKAKVEKNSVEKVAAEKTAAMTTTDVMKNHLVGGLAGVAAAAIGNAIVDKTREIMSRPAYTKSLDKAISINPRLQQRPREELEKYFDLIVEASPAVAKNPLLVANYLEYLLDHQGQLNYTAYSDLVRLESQIISNRMNTNPLSGAVQKAIVENTIRGAFDSKRKIEENDIKRDTQSKYEQQMDHMRKQHEEELQKARYAGMHFAYDAMSNNP